MKHFRSFAFHALLSLVPALVVPGCSKKSNPSAIQSRAEEYFKAGKFDEARIEYLNLTRANPGDAGAYRQVGIISAEQGSPLQAIAFLRKSLELEPGNVVARSALAQALMSLGDAASARKEAIAILKAEPMHDEALRLLAMTPATQEAFDFTAGQLDKARLPDRPGIHIAQAAFLNRKGDGAGAEAELKRALELEPKSIQAHLDLGSILMAKKETLRAGVEFKLAADAAPARSAARLRLAEYRVGLGALDDARDWLKETTKEARDFLPAWRLLAQIALAQKKYDEALASLENVFSRDPNDIDGRVLEAQVFAAKGEGKKSVEGLERLQRAYPKLPSVRRRLAEAYLREGNTSQAGAILREMLGSNPDDAEATLLLAQVNLRTGEFTAVVDALTALLKKQPRLPQAELLLIDAYRGLRRFDDAAGIVREQMKSFPRNPALPFMLGTILRQKGSLPEARTAFDQAQQLAPDDLRTTDQLVELDIIAKDFAAARERVKPRLEKAPGSSALHILSGKIYAAQREWAEAEAALLKAIELDPDSAAAYSLLIATYVAAGRLPEAASRAETMLAAKPDSLPAMFMAATIYERMNDYPKARDAYVKMLNRKPDFIPALNNLAVLYTDRLDQPDKAHELARKAWLLLPGDPAVADTYGWVLYKRGEHSQAFALFAESARKMPENPEIQFHLGMASHKLGRSDAARAAFEQALKSPAPFPGREEAERLLKSLGSPPGK